MKERIFWDYRPSGGISLGGFFLFFLGAIVAIALGLLAAFIAQYFYFIIMFPLAMLAAAAIIVSTVVKWGKIRNYLVAFLFGGIMGFVIYGAFWLGSYALFIETVYQLSISEGENYTRLELLELVNQDLEDETGYPHLLAYVFWTAEEGTDISIGRSGNALIHLDEQQTLIYWVIELGVILLLTPILTVAAAGEPFSENCKRWYSDASAKPVGYLLESNKDSFVQFLENGDLDAALSIVSKTNLWGIQLFAYQFADCPEDDVLLLGNNHEGHSEIEGMISSETLQRFQANLHEASNQQPITAGY